MSIPPVVFVVDDSIERRAKIRAFLDLQIQQTYTLLEANSRKAGLVLYQRSLHPIGLLYDFLPKNGLKFLRRLAQHTGHAQLPVIVLTDVENVAPAVEAIKLSGKNYLGWARLTAASLGAAVQSVMECGRSQQKSHTLPHSSSRFFCGNAYAV